MDTPWLMTESFGIVPEWPAPRGVKAFISTRTGGFSLPPYASNNFGLHVGDDPVLVEKNRAQLCERIGLIKTPQWLEQIHGVKVVNAKPDGVVRIADGSYSNVSGQGCLVMTADCLPVLLCDKQGRQVAALHCGWRSLAKGICERALQKFSGNPADILVFLGPAISQPNFEVGIDVLEAFFKSARTHEHSERVANAFVSAHRPLHFFADIYALAHAELNSLGVTAIYGGNYCTYRDTERFFSYRRDKTTGRMASLIWLE